MRSTHRSKSFLVKCFLPPRIEELCALIPAGAICQTFTRERLQALTGPYVYPFIKQGAVLYVGSSANGIMRVVCPGHHRRKVRAEADEIRIVWLDENAEPRLLEAELIRALRPPFNGKGTVSAYTDYQRPEPRNRRYTRPFRRPLPNGPAMQEPAKANTAEIINRAVVFRSRFPVPYEPHSNYQAHRSKLVFPQAYLRGRTAIHGVERQSPPLLP